METQTLQDQITDLLNYISCLKENGNENEIKTYLGVLFDTLFGRNGDGLRSLSSENILNQVDAIMSAYGVWKNYSKEKCALDNRKSLVHEIHSKLYAVLDLRVDIETLLNERLGCWPLAPENLQVNFSKEVIEQLKKIREENKDFLSDTLSNFFQKYFETLHNKAITVTNIKTEVESASKEYKRIEKHTDCLAMFANRNYGVVSSIKVTLSPSDTFDVSSPTDIGLEMKQAAKIAIGHTLRILHLNDHCHIKWMIEHPSTYEGSSIGLSLSVALIKAFTRTIRVDCYSGFTGEIDFNTGNVIKVGHVDEKLHGAENFGLRRVFVPKDNEQEAKTLSIRDMEIVPVESLSDILSKLVMLSKPTIGTQPGPSVEAKIKYFEIKCTNQNLSVTSGKDIPSGNQLIVSDFRNTIPVNIYDGQRGLRWVIGGNKTSNLYGLVEQVCTEVFGSINDKADNIKSNFCKWTIKESAFRSTIKNQLITMMDGKQMNEKNCDYRLDWLNGGQSVMVRQFTNGTLTVTGSPLSTRLYNDICRLIELAIGIPPTATQSPYIANESKSHDRTESNERSVNVTKKAIPEHATSWIGTDESGKGDYFGPLVSAGVCVNRKTELNLKSLGVKDSKKLSDENVKKLAKQIRTICRGHYAEVPIPPQTYNNLYNQFKRESKNLNTLLAWGHARAIENILSKVPCEYALADQFADERFILSKLQEAGRKIKLIQMPKAEQDIAVAAASILARDLFLSYLDKMSIEYHLKFPKGASAEVIRIARELIEKHGKDALAKVAKLHFKTTQEVLK
jgi:ribonuclease HIII